MDLKLRYKLILFWHPIYILYYIKFQINLCYPSIKIMKHILFTIEWKRFISQNHLISFASFLCRLRGTKLIEMIILNLRREHTQAEQGLHNSGSWQEARWGWWKLFTWKRYCHSVIYMTFIESYWCFYPFSVFDRLPESLSLSRSPKCFLSISLWRRFSITMVSISWLSEPFLQFLSPFSPSPC